MKIIVLFSALKAASSGLVHLNHDTRPLSIVLYINQKAIKNKEIFLSSFSYFSLQQQNCFSCQGNLYWILRWLHIFIHNLRLKGEIKCNKRGTMHFMCSEKPSPGANPVDHYERLISVYSNLLHPSHYLNYQGCQYLTHVTSIPDRYSGYSSTNTYNISSW